MREIEEIIVHCTATPRGREVTVKEIDLWHRERGWNGIGYHWVVYNDGTIHSGRAEGEPGAHCQGHNQKSIGVVYTGGTEANGEPSDTRTEAQKASLERLISDLKRRYRGARVYGHRDFAKKACPCFDAKKEYN